MRILHCCLAAFYIDNYGYQENILPKMHKLQGHDVAILASTETYICNKSLGYVKPRTYVNEDDIPVTRISYVNWLPQYAVRKLRVYLNIGAFLNKFEPDIIFLHGTQFLSTVSIKQYLKANSKVRVYADCHSDFNNSAKGLVAKYVLHGILYKWATNLISPYVSKFFGTLPDRVSFLIDFYRIPSEKVSLLELGADDSSFNIAEKDRVRRERRRELLIAENDFVIVTGGKIDKRKNIHLLVNAVSRLTQSDIKLLIFGTPDDEMAFLIDEIKKNANCIFVGWQKPRDIYSLLFLADVGFFPGTHSVLWEQSCGVGLPCVFKSWNNFNHVDLGGNCIFLNDISEDSIIETILILYSRRSVLLRMKHIAEERGIKQFSYSSIAKRAIEES